MAQKKAKTKGTRFYDYTLVFIVIFLCCFGLVMVFSTSYYTAALKYSDTLYYVKKQGAFMLLGVILMLVVSKIDYHILRKLAIPAWLVSFAVMAATNYIPGFGRSVNGQKRWFQIGGHALFQSSELVKISIIAGAAALFTYLGVSRLIDSQKPTDVLKGLVVWGVVVLPLDYMVVDNNLSTGIIIAGVAFVMLFVAVKRKAFFAVLAGGAVALAAIFVRFCEKFVDMGILEPYQVQRILAWQHPEDYAITSAMQTLQGLYAIGSGGLFGKGLGNSIQKLGFVPEAQNDMIFSIVCEELGLFGALAVILLFLFLIYRLFVIARNAPDMFGSMLVVGVMAHISLQVILNIAVVTNFIPNTGVTLPFFSYGGTAVIFLLLEMGIALSVSNRIIVDEKSGERVLPNEGGSPVSGLIGALAGRITVSRRRRARAAEQQASQRRRAAAQSSGGRTESPLRSARTSRAQTTRVQALRERNTRETYAREPYEHETYTRPAAPVRGQRLTAEQREQLAAAHRAGYDPYAPQVPPAEETGRTSATRGKNTRRSRLSRGRSNTRRGRNGRR